MNFTEEHAIGMLEDCKGSIRELHRAFKWMRHAFGQKAFSPNLREKLKEHLNILQDYHEAELTVFHDKDGQEIKTCISKVIDFEMFVTEIARVRGYEDPEVILGCDGDSEKIILTCIIRDMNQEENENTLDNYGPAYPC